MWTCACRTAVCGNIRCAAIPTTAPDTRLPSSARRRDVEARSGLTRTIREGSEVHISAPRNNLPLSDKGERYILVAGGIGITPLLSMARTLKRWGKDFILHYCARSASEAPLLAELEDICGPRLTCWFSATGPRFDPEVIGPYDANTHVTICGPQRLLDAVQSALSAWPEDQVHSEVFQMTVDENFKPEPFEATVASTGQRFLCRPTGRCSMCCATTLSSCRHPAKWVSAAPANAAIAMAWCCIGTRCCRRRNGRIGSCCAYRAPASA